jgi:hypothetical protein
VSFVALEEEAL